MKIERVALGALSTNCYLIVNEETKEALIVDPASCPKKFRDMIEEKGYIPQAILLTHGHFDHVMGIDKCVEAYDIPVYLYKDEVELLARPELNLSENFGITYAYSNGKTFSDNENVELAGMKFKVIHTPGHTKGSCCYYFEKEHVLISGDTLFELSVGRTDFPTSSTSQIVRSVREKLFILPDDVVVYPGHGDETNIAFEKVNNMFV